MFAFLKTLLYNEFINLKHYFYVVDFSKVSPLVALRLYHLHNTCYAKYEGSWVIIPYLMADFSRIKTHQRWLAAIGLMGSFMIVKP